MVSAAVQSDPHPDQDFLAVSKAVADPLRAGVLRTLARDSFSVLELCRVFEVAQPALSHHLKLLLNAGLVAKRREGNNIYYRRATLSHCQLEAYVASIFQTLDGLPDETRIQAGIERIHAERVRSSQAFFADNADRFENQQALICTPATYADAAAELVDDLNPNTSVLEVGPGDGDLLLHLATRFKHVDAIDNVPAMLDRARRRISEREVANVDFDVAHFSDLVDRDYSLIVAAMVLHHAPSPAAFLKHAAELLDPTGVLLVIELCDHDQDWVKAACGDLWLGFEPDELDAWATDAGLDNSASQYLAQRNGFRIQLRRYEKRRPQIHR